MFGVSFPELLVIGIITLIIFGPERLPEIAKLLGKYTAEFKKGADAVRREFYNNAYPPFDPLKETPQRNLTSVSPEKTTPDTPSSSTHDEKKTPES